MALPQLKRLSLSAFCILLSMMQSIDASAQFPPGTNVDDSKVPAYVLPDPLVMSNGKKVKDVNEVKKELAEVKDKASYNIKVKRNGTDMNLEVKIPKKVNKADL